MRSLTTFYTIGPAIEKKAPPDFHTRTGEGGEVPHSTYVRYDSPTGISANIEAQGGLVRGFVLSIDRLFLYIVALPQNSTSTSIGLEKQALDDFARDNNIKPESIKKAYKRFQVRACLGVIPLIVASRTGPTNVCHGSHAGLHCIYISLGILSACSAYRITEEILRISERELLQCVLSIAAPEPGGTSYRTARNGNFLNGSLRRSSIIVLGLF